MTIVNRASSVTNIPDYPMDDLADSRSIEVLQLLDRMSVAIDSRFDLQYDLDLLMNIVIFQDDPEQSECMGVIQNYRNDLIRQRACLSLLSAACLHARATENNAIFEKLNALVFPSVQHLSWTELIDTWGKEAIGRIADVINPLNAEGVLTGSCRRLCQQLGMALFESGRAIQRQLEPTVEAALFPANIHVSRVESALKKLESASDTICSAYDFDDVIASIINDLTPPSGEHFDLTGEQEAQMIDSCSTMRKGLSLLAPEVLSTEMFDKIHPYTDGVLLDHIRDQAQAEVVTKLVGKEVPPNTLAGFSAFYLLDGFDSVLKSFYTGGLNPTVSAHIFVRVARKVFDIMNIDGRAFLNRLREGQACSESLDVSDAFLSSDCYSKVSAKLFADMQQIMIDRLISLSEYEAIPIQLGWNDSEPGHLMWGILFKRQIRVINTGCGLYDYHGKVPSSSGVGNVFQLSRISRVFSKAEFREYLFRVTLLQHPKSLTSLVKCINQPDQSSLRTRIALAMHYSPLGRGADDPILIKGQKSITCSTTILKAVVRAIAPDQYPDFKLISSMMVFATWFSRIEKEGFQTETEVALKQMLAKAIFSRFTNKPAPLLEEIARHLIKDWSWRWQCVPIMRSAYFGYMREHNYQQAADWLDYIYRKNMPLGIQCTAETIDRFVDGLLPGEVVIKTLEILTNNSKYNLVDSYKSLEERCLKLDSLPWADLINHRPDLVETLLDQMSQAGCCTSLQNRLHAQFAG